VFKRGQNVTVTQLSHDDGSSAHFVGRTGTVTGHVGEAITVKGLAADQPEKSYGFFPEEIKPA